MARTGGGAQGRHRAPGPIGAALRSGGCVFLGLYETALQPGEIVVAVRFDAAQTGARHHFDELARRHGDYAAAGIAAVAPANAATWRLVFFGVGVTPVRVDVVAPEGDLPRWQRDVVDAVGRQIEPLADLHFSMQAKRHLAKTLTQRALVALAGDLSHA